MTESLTLGKPAKRSRVTFARIFVVLVLVIALALVYSYQQDQYAFVMFFYSITQRINIGEAGVLSGEPCAAPCVFGIQAGETQFDEVPPLLEKYGVSKCATEPNISWVAIHCGFGRFNVQASTQTNLVNGIWFYPNDSISIGELIGKYGEPNFVFANPMVTLEPPTIQVYLYWDSIRMSVVLPEIEGKIYVVEKTTDIEGVDFSDEELYPGSAESGLAAYYKPWHGYGTYQP